MILGNWGVLLNVNEKLKLQPSFQYSRWKFSFTVILLKQKKGNVKLFPQNTTLSESNCSVLTLNKAQQS